MEGIDWNRYHELCIEVTRPAVERFAEALRSAVGVATEQSIPVFSGEMRGSLLTVLRQMTDILKQLSQAQLTQSQINNINWKDTQSRLREMYFLRLAQIENMQIASEYVRERLQNELPQKGQIYHWVYSLQGNEDEVERIIRQTGEAVGEFSLKDVPKIMELAILGIRRPR